MKGFFPRLREVFSSIFGPCSDPAGEKPLYRAINLSREGAVLASRMDLAANSEARTTGLLKRESLGEGEGLWIRPCMSVHSFGMKFAIDVIYIDRKNRVRKVVGALRPGRISFCLVARSVLELPAGAAAATQTAGGDQLEITPLIDASALPEER
jgi:uncharacterized protein